MVVAFTLVVFHAPAAGQVAPKGDNAQVTFTKDIAPILQRSCQRCHRPDSIAPMSLLTYEEARPWARAIKYRTGLRNKPDAMPPWYVEKNIGIQQFKGDISLSDEEVAKIARWADSGAPRGNPADMPPPLTFGDAATWQLGQPDLIVWSPAVDMAPTAPDWWGALKDVPTGLTEDRYVASVEMREVNDLERRIERQTIGGRFIFHHLVWNAVRADEVKVSEDETAAAVRTGWPVHEVGRNADAFDPDAGILLKADSKLVFPSAHMHSTGRQTKGHVEFGFKFHPKGYQPKTKLQSVTTASGALDIRAMESNQKFEAFSVLPEHTKMINYEPHMHAAGVRMCLDAIWGTMVETLSCSGYNHGWVRVYTYADDAAPLLPKGTILRITGYFDNTPANKNVSDPRNWSGLGHRSMDNMMINIGKGIYLNDDEFRQEVAQRREKLHLAEGQTVIGCPLCGYSKIPVESKPAAATAGSQQP
jgi:hypothetical protein